MAEVEEAKEDLEQECYSDYEEVEPSLKYGRNIKAQLTSVIFKNSQATCITVNEKFIVLGDFRGQVFVLDHGGNINRQINAHKGPVTCLSVDPDGEYVASCSSQDTSVVIKGLYSMERDMSESYPNNVFSVELGPSFSSQHHYIVGTDRLTYNEKGFFGLKRTLIHSGEGPIWATKWRRNFIAWANALGVKVYHTVTKKLITRIGRGPKAPSPAEYLCHLYWHNDWTLVIGWACSIKICQVRQKSDSDFSALPTYFVEVLNNISLDHFISGIGPQPDNKIVTLGYIPPEEGVPSLPCVRITNFDGAELSLDELSIKGYETCHANSYKISVLNYDHHIYIMSPVDLVIAKPRDLNDRIDWLISKGKYEGALNIVSEAPLTFTPYKFINIGAQYFAHLRDLGEFEECAKNCQKILYIDKVDQPVNEKIRERLEKIKDAWEVEILAFQKYKKLHELCAYIPVKKPRLDSWAYELALSSFLGAGDWKNFEAFLTKWPTDLYRPEAVINYLVKVLNETKLESDDKKLLLKCLGILYEYHEDHVSALIIYIKLSNKRAFEILGRHHRLFQSLSGDDKILKLMKVNVDAAINLFINNTEKIPVSMVASSIKSNRKYYYKYLDRLFEFDPEAGFEYHKDMIELYAEFDTTDGKSKLITFLKESTSYPIDEAYRICQERKLYEAQVYLLTRMGHSVQALSLLIDDIGDIGQAIDFCKEQDDHELWDNLLTKATQSKKSSYITDLLQNIGTHINPKELIARIPNGKKIDNLRDSLVKILCDYKLQIDLSQGCKRVFVSDTVKLSQKLRALGKRAVLVDDDSQCQSCRGMIVNSDASDVVVYFCGHVFHHVCVTKDYCASCHK